jgi:simple sugar transport system permease protein
MAQGDGFPRDMGASRGYLTLAAPIFGKWRRPWPVLSARLLFATADAAQARLQGGTLPGIGVVSVQLIQMTPYLITLAILTGFVRPARPPRVWQPYSPAR